MDELLTFFTSGTYQKDNSIGATAVELQGIFGESIPYSTTETLSGLCYIWDEDFIEKCQMAMSTNALTQMEDQELQVWKEFVEYEDGKSSTVPTDTTVQNAVGCTIPDGLNNSYIVQEDGTVTTVLCDDPLARVQKENVSASLDAVFMAIYNCEEYNNCGIIDGIQEDVSPCIIPVQI